MLVRLKLRSQKRASAGAQQSVAIQPAPEKSLSASSCTSAATSLTQEVSGNTVALARDTLTGVPRIKTYRVAEIRHAMAAASRELGEDAILIQTKRLDAQEDSVRYEVTFGVIGGKPQPVAKASSGPESPAPLPATTGAPTELGWAQEFGRLREDMAALQAMLSRHYWDPESVVSTKRKSVTLRNQLVQHGVDSDLASEWALALENSVAVHLAPHEEITAAMLEQHISSRVRVDASAGWDSSQGKALMLLGPAASGKTTSILKIALEFGIKHGRSVEIWALDSRRTGAEQATEDFARLLNIPCRTLQSPHAVTGALAKIKLDNCLVLIDTKNIGTGSVDHDQELANMLSNGVAIDCHLVLPAAWHPAALRRAVDRYEIFQPSRLLFTMLDETCTFGPMLQEPWRTRKPLSFFSEGPLGSGQIQPASLQLVLKNIEQPVAG